MAYTTIDKPTDYIRIQTWSGDNSADREITWTESDNMQPDWIWVKRRSDTANHRLADSVRGATKILRSDTNGAESTETDDTLSFDTNGFSVGNNSGVNKTGDTYVGWGWLAGGTASSNTDGSITSSVSENTTAGFSIVSYTGNGTAGATVGHGLGIAPDVVINKNRDTTNTSWAVYHKSIGTNLVFLDATDASASYSTIYNNTAPSSSVVTLGSGSNANKNTNEIILYCFAEKKGYSKFGSYTGNGNADGTFVYTGFKPAFVIIKQSSAARDWIMVDNKRSTFNVVDKRLFPNNSDAENTSVDALDFTSNGFKIRNTNTTVNVSGGTYIYMAFAENPFVTSTGICCTAR